MGIQSQKDIKKLRKNEMLEMLLLQAVEIEKLQKENEELSKKLEDRTLAVEKAGTMAEASLLVTNVLMEAERAAKIYLENIERMNGDVEQITAVERDKARCEAEKILLQANQSASMVKERARREADAYWSEISAKMELFYEEHKGLREMLGSFGGTSA